jgi:hypothetical protein
MTTDDDTDPSTPTARRPTEGGEGTFDDTDPVLMAIKAPRPSTHPGVGPPADTRPAPSQPMGIVAPTVGPDIRKDSVELLLDGISGSQPARTKTTPQTDGEASASYHSRHDVRRAHTSPDEEPKVVIEHSAQFPTMRIERSQVPSLGALGPTRELTLIPAVALWPRVVIAAGAGLIVVLCLFVVSHLTMRGGQAAESTKAALPAAPEGTIATPQAVAPATTGASAGASAASAPAVSVSTSAQTESPSPSAVSASAPALVASASGAPPVPLAIAGSVSSEAHATPATAVTPPMSSAPLPRPRPRPPIAVPANATRDLGELKTTFH